MSFFTFDTDIGCNPSPTRLAGTSAIYPIWIASDIPGRRSSGGFDYVRWSFWQYRVLFFLTVWPDASQQGLSMLLAVERFRRHFHYFLRPVRPIPVVREGGSCHVLESSPHIIYRHVLRFTASYDICPSTLVNGPHRREYENTSSTPSRMLQVGFN